MRYYVSKTCKVEEISQGKPVWFIGRKRGIKKEAFFKIINDFFDHTDFTDDVKEKLKDNVWFLLKTGNEVNLGEQTLYIKKFFSF